MINLISMALKFNYSVSEKKIELLLLDQTLLPQTEKWLLIQNLDQMIEAIQSLRVRGAPLIGVGASLYLAKESLSVTNKNDLLKIADLLYEARPTAVNLMNCLDRMKKTIHENLNSEKIVETAIQLFNEDVKLCDQIATNGAELISDGDQIFTHCNTGGLATAGVGTALGVIRRAHEQGKKIHVYIDETRPLLQGGRLTAWELQKLNIPCTLITDNMAAHLMSLKKITKAIVGSDRIAANGDFANKIGTYSVAVNCFYHQIPFYAAAPFTTVDPQCKSGSQIPIEQRRPEEVLGAIGNFGVATDGRILDRIQWAPSGVQVYNPSFDVTPEKLTSAWIMDQKVFTKKDILEGCFL
jgi:methylthioribose-1-phosphate isomerase